MKKIKNVLLFFKNEHSHKHTTNYCCYRKR